MFWLNSCPRCHGDLCGSEDKWGDFIECVQCGHTFTEFEEAWLLTDPTLSETPVFPPAGHIKLPPNNIS